MDDEITMGLPLPIVTPKLGAPAPGDWHQPPDPLKDFVNWDREDWRQNREDFNDAMQRRADEIGHDKACSEVAVTAMRHFRNVRLEVDSNPRGFRGDAVQRWRESERRERANRMFQDFTDRRRVIAHEYLERHGVNEVDARAIIGAWRTLHGVPDADAFNRDHPDYIGVYPTCDELDRILAERKRNAPPKPSKARPRAGVRAPSPPVDDRPVRTDLLEAAGATAAPKRARSRAGVRRGKS